MAAPKNNAVGGDGASSSSSSHTIPDHFHPDDIEDASNPYPRPLFLVPLPPIARRTNGEDGGDDDDAGAVAADVLAYGGDDGKIYLFGGSGGDGGIPREIRRYDDEVRAVAVSPDGRRVSVGFDDGSSRIYAYDDDDYGRTSEGEDGPAHHHPFVPPKKSARSDNDDDDDDDEGGFFSQGGLSQEDDDDDKNGREFDGPRADAPVRQMAFDPRGGSARSGAGGPYRLAIASESGNAPVVVVDVANAQSATRPHLGERGAEEHEAGGVRSVGFSVVGTNEVGSEDGKNNNVLLASLGMDGRLVTWDVTSDDPLFWDVCRKDVGRAVPRADGGMAGDAGDKGCRVVWDVVAGGKRGGDPNAVLFLPGQTDLQYKLCPLSKSQGGTAEALTAGECGGHLGGPSKFIVDARGEGHKDTIVAMAARSDGARNRIATGGRDGKLLLWNLDLQEGTGEAREIPLERKATTFGIPPITGIVWRMEEELHVAFADGTVATVPVPEGESESERDEALEEEMDEEVDGLVTQPVENDVDENVAPKKKKLTFKDEDSDVEFAKGAIDDDASAKGDPVDSTTSSKQKDDEQDLAAEKGALKRKEASKFINDEAEAGDDDDDDNDDVEFDDVIQTPNKEKDAQGNKNNAEPAAQDAEANPEDDFDENMFDGHGDTDDFDAVPHDQPYHKLPDPQPAFAPSSTPLGEPRRILCWNHVGVVTLRSDNEDAGSNLNLVDIAFHETAGLVGGRRPVTLTDNTGYIVGTLGEEGAMFATDLLEDPDESDDEGDEDLPDRIARRAARRAGLRGTRGARGSRVHFHRFETFGRIADKDWNAALPDGERALGCATGSCWGAVITSRRFLRLFTISGIQGPVHWIPGEPVTVVGRDRFVAVFYHRSSTPMQDGTQLLGYSIVDGITGATVATGDVSALSQGTSLSWVGFTDKCALSVMDSDGMLSMLARYSSNSNGSSNGGNWMPMLDTLGLKKSTSDSFWPVEVYGGKLVCVPLRGGKEHPDAARRPVTTTLSLRIPLATGMKSGPLEEGSVRATFALNQDKVMSDYLVSQGEANEDEMEEEYAQKCNQVDKVTLKLFGAVIQSGKVERGYDLVQRLHSEKSYDIAIQMADRIGHRNLSDRIDELRLQKFPPIDEEEEVFDDDAASFESGMHRGGRSASFDENEPLVTTRQQQMEHMRRGISPDRGEAYTPKQLRSREHDAEDLPEDAYSTTDEESPPRQQLKRKFEQENHNETLSANKKRINPFAKKKMESPAKGIMRVVGSPTKMSLSRSSTFSAKSRQKKRNGKQIV